MKEPVSGYWPHRVRLCCTGTDERVHLVDEQDDAAVLADFVDEPFQPFFELPAVFRTSTNEAMESEITFLSRSI